MSDTTKPVLVVGGGISGITVATELADVGRKVILIEKNHYLGGNVIKMNNYFPKLCPPSCGLEIYFRRIKQNSAIHVITSSHVLDISGEKGNFTVMIESDPEYVNHNCTACGECEKVCPVLRPDDFNNFFGNTKCIFLPHPMAYPYKYCLDDMYCEKEDCHLCRDVCKYNAIDLNAQKSRKSVNVSAIVFASGWRPYDMLSIENLNGGRYENIINNLDMERLLAPNGPGKGRVFRPADGKEPENIVFVQCAGSRDENNLPYCSVVCCPATLKQAISFREKYPGSTVKIFYIDLRVSGRNEDFLVKAQSDKDIEFIKGKVGRIEEEPDTKNLIVEAEDVISCKKKKVIADMVILATGIYPNFLNNLELIQKKSGFYDEYQQEGVFVCSCARKPMDVASSIKDATAIALKALIASR